MHEKIMETGVAPTIRAAGEYEPVVPASVWVADGARILGRTAIGERASVWFNAVVRADINEIHIGPESNIQDLTMMHVADEWPCIVGRETTVGHNVILHGCEVGDFCTVGMGAILMNGVKVGSGSIVASGALLTQGKEYPSRSLILGSPAKVIRETTDEELEANRAMAAKYARIAAGYLKQWREGQK